MSLPANGIHKTLPIVLIWPKAGAVIIDVAIHGLLTLGQIIVKY